MNVHVFGVTDDDQLWHSLIPVQGNFGDVDRDGGTGRPWEATTPKPKVKDSACAADKDGNLHVLVVTDDGRLWHTIRARSGAWIRFGDVEQGGAGNIGKITAVGAATEGGKLHIFAVSADKKLHATVWNPPSGTQLAEFNPKFTEVTRWKAEQGQLKVLATASSLE